MNSQGEANISTYLYGILVFTLLVVGGISMYGLFLKDTTLTNEPKYIEFNNSFNKLSDVNAQIDKLETGLQNDDQNDFGIFGVLNSLINKAWQTLKLMGSSFSFMNDVFKGLTTVFGVPAWIPALIISFVTVLISFAIYSAIFQKKV